MKKAKLACISLALVAGFTASARELITKESAVARRDSMDSTISRMEAIAKATGDMSALGAVSFLQERERLAYPAPNGVSYLEPVPKNGMYIAYVPVMDEDKSLVEGWSAVHFRIVGPVFGTIGGHRSLIVPQSVPTPAYYVSLFHEAYKAFLAYERPYDKEGTEASRMESYQAVRLDGVILYQTGGAAYRRAYDAASTEMVAYAQTHSNSTDMHWPKRTSVRALCSTLDAVHGAVEESVMMRVAYLSLAFKSIDSMPYNDAQRLSLKKYIVSEYDSRPTVPVRKKK